MYGYGPPQLLISTGGLYICSRYGGPVSPSTIVEVTYIDYINDFVSYRSTDLSISRNCTIGVFQTYFEDYVPCSVDEGLSHVGPKCECGLFATLGKNVEPWQHSDYCPVYVKREKA